MAVVPVQMKHMSIIHIPLSELFDKLSSHHTQTKNIHLNITKLMIYLHSFILISNHAAIFIVGTVGFQKLIDYLKHVKSL